jgi:hypothetical protein
VTASRSGRRCRAPAASFAQRLVFDSPIDYLESEYESWEVDRGTEWDRGAFVVELAPDVLHKAGVSGGPPYSVAVPNGGIDGLLLGSATRRHS